MSTASPSATTPGFSITPGEASQVPLTEDEQRMVAKLLGDPTYFPIEFRRWLEDFLGTSNFKISKSQIMGGSGGGASDNPTLLPAGIILPFAGSVFGKDCLPCNGASLSRDSYPELFNAIGVAWGSADSTTFKVPDLRDRAMYGVGSVVSLGATDGKGLGNRGGPFHHHGVTGQTDTQGQHAHNVSGSTSSPGNHGHSYQVPQGSVLFQTGTQGAMQSAANYALNTITTGQAGDHTHSVSGSTDSKGGHQHAISAQTTGGYDTDKPSYAGITFVITTGKADATLGA